MCFNEGVGSKRRGEQVRYEGGCLSYCLPTLPLANDTISTYFLGWGGSDSGMGGWMDRMLQLDIPH